MNYGWARVKRERRFQQEAADVLRKQGEKKSEQETEQSAARAPILTICRGYLKIGMQRFVFLLERRKKRFCSCNENAATSPMNRAAMFVPPPQKKEGLSTYCFNDPAARHICSV